MRAYDRSSPLIFIHIPKTGGSSVRAVFGRWYGNGLHLHYRDKQTNAPPVAFDMRSLRAGSPPVAIYGHIWRPEFRRHYPEVRQFVTVLRDPLERAISAYHFARARASKLADLPAALQGDLSGFLKHCGKGLFNKCFPRKVTRENYRELIEEFFVEIGVTEHLEQSMRRIAARLGMPFDPDWLPRLNATPRDQEPLAGLREQFMEKRALEYEVYNYVALRFAPSAQALAG